MLKSLLTSVLKDFGGIFLGFIEITFKEVLKLQIA